MNIHMRIREKRLALGLSMEALAEMVGVRAWQTVQQWEREDGGTAPKRDRLNKVAEALRTTPEYLLFGKPPAVPGGNDEKEAPTEASRQMAVMALGSAENSWTANVERPDAKAFLFLVPDDRMAPRYLPGDYAIIEPEITPEVEDDVLVGFVDGRVALMRLLSRRGGIRLGTWGDQAAASFEAKDIAWMHYASGFIPARKVTRT
ncbi:helix-turn-helix domain-containing protein [Burkholderia sp. BCC1985]|uniref:helix-turn-helix domain-containing protein n=1 Tax=Burkholderia sp. BCC1985 TaxID=2817442 RepID=UPI002AB00A70|nr:helix-turn-helix domain-containing protein [Burkholderia sp. BCC1985]